jgi:broad specificity phosphatase PhoE
LAFPLKIIYSSDLKRAVNTAKIIQRTQWEACGDEILKLSSIASEVTQYAVLREQDFGYYEGKPFFARASAGAQKSGKEDHRDEHRDEEGFVDVESKESMAKRIDGFIDGCLIGEICLANQNDPEIGRNIAIVAHGIILGVLWRCLLKRFSAQSVRVKPGIVTGGAHGASLEHLGGWANTAYLQLELCSPTATEDIADTAPVREDQLNTNELETGCKFATTKINPPTKDPEKYLEPMWRDGDPPQTMVGWTMTIEAVNSRDHLKGLKRTGGGVGSSKHDEGQMKIENFFNKRQRTS